MLRRTLLLNKFCRFRFNHNSASEALPHTPVLSKEVVSYLSPEKGSIFVDMTFGAGGHTKALIDSNPDMKIFCLDRDPEAYDLAVRLSKDYNQVVPCLGKFSELPNVSSLKPGTVDGILFDFGCSSMQFDSAERGFSISKDGPLDMRMDSSEGSPTAADVLAHADEEDLARIFKVYGQEKRAKKIARAIVETRFSFNPIRTTEDLANLVANCSPSEYGKDKLQRPAHAATKVFQALRIFVNNELNEIDYAMVVAHRYLKIGGRLVAISFHSLEDTIVKRHLTGNIINNSTNPLPLKYSASNISYDSTEMEVVKNTSWLPLNKHVVTPIEEEINANPRSRSAKLRAAVKLK